MTTSCLVCEKTAKARGLCAACYSAALRAMQQERIETTVALCFEMHRAAAEAKKASDTAYLAQTYKEYGI